MYTTQSGIHRIAKNTDSISFAFFIIFPRFYSFLLLIRYFLGKSSQINEYFLNFLFFSNKKRSVQLCAENQNQGCEIQPDQRYDYCAQGAIYGRVVCDIFHIEGISDADDEPGKKCGKNAGQKRFNWWPVLQSRAVERSDGKRHQKTDGQKPQILPDVQKIIR